MPEFDVFLAHNAVDKISALKIAELLRQEGLRPWLDEWQLVPGATWQDGLADGVASSRCAAFLVGSNGLGPWQSAEAMLILNRAFRDSSFRLIPVLLPGARAEIDSLLPSFVSLFTWVDFRAGIRDPAALRRLVAGVRGESPGRASPSLAKPRHSQQMNDVDRTLEALGVPKMDVGRVAEWLAQSIAGEPLIVDFPDGHWSAQSRQAVIRLERDIQLFAWPERLLESSFYLSVSKIARMYRAHRDELPPEDDVFARFRILHRYMSERGRLAFGPSLVLLDEPLPSGDDTWLYFTGDFTTGHSADDFDRLPEAQRIVITRDERNLFHLASQVVERSDPFFLPMLAFSGSVGTYKLIMLLSRKHIALQSHSATAIGSALLGQDITLAGFGTLVGRELQPIICSIRSHGG
jgi:TIR domain-containing protein